MNIFRSYRVDTSSYVVVNKQYCYENFQELIDFVRYYWREVILISDHFESLQLDEPLDENEKKVCDFIKLNLNRIRICDLYNFDEIGFKYYLKNGIQSSGNENVIKNLLDFESNKETNFLFISNRVKNYRINLLNFLVKNNYDKNICIKFNSADGGNSDTPKIFYDCDDINPITPIPFINKKFKKIFGTNEPIFTNSITYSPSDFPTAISYSQKSRYFISTESSISSYCVSEKTAIPLISKSIPLLICSAQNYKNLSKIGFTFNYFFIYSKLSEYYNNFRKILNFSDNDLIDYYQYYKVDIIQNHNLIKQFIFED